MHRFRKHIVRSFLTAIDDSKLHLSPENSVLTDGLFAQPLHYFRRRIYWMLQYPKSDRAELQEPSHDTNLGQTCDMC
jgi:hypothetical protein